MIIQPDFLDHWKTRMLCDILQDEAAPIYVIRLWAHCQNRKTHRLPTGNPTAIKAICHSPHDAEKFHSAMIEAGFLREDDDGLYAHEWDSVNQYLVNSWENGKKGGRPKKETNTKPTDNPKLTQTEPIREEKINNREDKIVEVERRPRNTIEEFKDSPPHAIKMVQEVLNCRPEFKTLNPEPLFRLINDTKDNPLQMNNHEEFIADMANSLALPKIPAKTYGRYLNSDGYKKKQESGVATI